MKRREGRGRKARYLCDGFVEDRTNTQQLRLPSVMVGVVSHSCYGVLHWQSEGDGNLFLDNDTILASTKTHPILRSRSTTRPINQPLSVEECYL